MAQGRPKKDRLIKSKPKVAQFSPRGIRGRPGYTDLEIEEYEAIRLSDHVCLVQSESAASMGISQQTFSRILKRAHKRLAEAIIKGDIIRIKPKEKNVTRAVLKALTALILIYIASSLSGCASIPIPSSIPIPNNFPILGAFL